jgi:hypothetical protein
MPRRPQPLRIAVDTGGTFTDCVWLERGRLRMLKVFSTPADPSQAIVEALRKIVPEQERDRELILLHGTTVGTNTLLERKGARTVLVTTAGFEDAIEIGRQARPKLYDFFFDRIEPLVPRHLRFGVNERTAADGEILTSPTPQELHAIAEQLAAAKPESIAISFLFSFANPKNELAAADALELARRPALHLPPNPPRIPRVRAHLDGSHQRLPPTGDAALPGKSGSEISSQKHFPCGRGRPARAGQGNEPGKRGQWSGTPPQRRNAHRQRGRAAL